MLLEEVVAKHNALKTAAQEFYQMVSSLNGNWDGKMSEIKSLEMKRDKLKDEVDRMQNKANEILQKASEESSRMMKEANRVSDEARMAKADAEEAVRSAQKLKSEAQGILAQAADRERSANAQWQIINAKAKKLEEALK